MMIIAINNYTNGNRCVLSMKSKSMCFVGQFTKFSASQRSSCNCTARTVYRNKSCCTFFLSLLDLSQLVVRQFLKDWWQDNEVVILLLRTPNSTPQGIGNKIFFSIVRNLTSEVFSRILLLSHRNSFGFKLSFELVK